MSGIDLRDVENGDELTIELETGETFTGTAVDIEHEHADDYGSGHVEFAFEGDWWERINDRVDTEVLSVRQTLKRRTSEPGDVSLAGVVWRGEPKETSTSEYVELGEVSEVDY